MPDVDIQFDPGQLRRAEERLAAVGRPNGLKQAARRAVARTARAVRAEAVKKLAAATGLKQTEVRTKHTRIRIQPASLAATITITGRGIPLAKLRPRQIAAGVSYSTPEGRRTRLGAFLATMPTGHQGAFKRLRQTRLPIKEQYGPSILEVIRGKLPEIQTDAAARLHKELNAQVNLIIEKANR